MFSAHRAVYPKIGAPPSASTGVQETLSESCVEPTIEGGGGAAGIEISVHTLYEDGLLSAAA